MKKVKSLLLVLLCLSCSNDRSIQPTTDSQDLNQINPKDFGLIHNQAMEFIGYKHDVLMNSKDLGQSVHNLSLEFLSKNFDDVDLINSNHSEVFRMMSTDDNIHLHFEKNIQNIKKGYSALKAANLINHLDEKKINELIDLLFEANELIVDNSAHMTNEKEFIDAFNIMYSDYQKMDNPSGVLQGIMEITNSSLQYWENKNFDHAPEFIKASYNEMIIPAIVLRVVVKDAIGAIEGAITTGLFSRLLNGDWDWDTGKISEREALIGMLIGAVTSSGGFMGKMAVRALKLL